MKTQVYWFFSLAAVSWLYAVSHLNRVWREDNLLFIALIIQLGFIVLAAGFFSLIILGYFSPRMKRLQLRIIHLNQSPFWRQADSYAELARQVCKAGLTNYHPVYSIDWFRYATTSSTSISEPEPIIPLQPNNNRPNKYRQRQIRKRRNLIANDNTNSNNSTSYSKKYAVLATGIPGRIALARSIGSAEIDCGIVELPGFLTAEECDALVEEFDDTYGIDKMHAPNDTYKGEKLNPDAATYKMRYLANSLSLTTTAASTMMAKKVSKTPQLDKLKKMVEPFSDTKYVGKFKRYLAADSSQLGTLIHTDGSPYTLLIYLDTVPLNAGGYTEFVNLGLRFQPVKGNAIWFRNVHLDHLGAGSLNNLDERIRHCGGPLLKGKKTIIQFQDHFFGAKNV